MIKGQPPFKGRQTTEIIAAQMFRPPPPLGPVDPPTPRWLDTLVARMLAKQPAKRPASMEVVARILARANGRFWGGAAEPEREGFLPRLQQTLRVRRPRTGFDLFIVAGTAALTLAVGGLWAGQTVVSREKPPVVRPLSVAVVQAQPAEIDSSQPEPTPTPTSTMRSRPDGGATSAVPAPSSVRTPPARRASRSARSPARRTRPVVEMDGLVDL
jgi:hypothetical protein